MRILVTAGPTREPIDPIRFISNYSTGYMGYAIAKVARKRKHRVTLISGPTNLMPPPGVRVVKVKTALEMKRAVEKYFPLVDCVIMAAAVTDYRPRKVARAKIKRDSIRSQRLKLELAKNPDILAGLGKRKGKRILVGFALETEALIKNALVKLKSKKLDLIVGNKAISSQTSPSTMTPFGDEKIEAVIIDKSGFAEKVPKSSKNRLADVLLKKIEKSAVLKI